ncbi:ADP-ribosylglycohydrolase family protein [Rothia halotolerans]|uniref:ADP-ribosylglycohydrolase family protein n=1 Tax=Rothia halotolerans TaxID=405770 RepID=UPI00101C7065|nr:ADP-ribosylglycohydrolase family protein [Rothia halotolerans]
MQPNDSPFSAPSPAHPDYPGLVGTLWSLAGSGPVAEAAGVVAVSEGLAEVLGWAALGQDADETASVWLEQLRWAAALGLEPEDGAPVPPASWWEAGVARELTRAGEDPRAELPGLCRALVLGQLQYPARTELGGHDDAGFMGRLVSLAVHPRDSPAHLGQLAVNLTCLTHGHPEALGTGMAWALLLRACLRHGGGAARAEAAAGDREAVSGEQEPAPGKQEAGEREAAPEPHRVLDLGLDAVRTLLDADDAAADASAAPEGLLARMAAGGGSVPALARVLQAAPRTREALREAGPGPASRSSSWDATTDDPAGRDRAGGPVGAAGTVGADDSTGTGDSTGTDSSTGKPAAPAALARIIEQARRVCLDGVGAPGDDRPDAGALEAAGPEEPARSIARGARLLAICCGAPAARPAEEERISEIVAESAERWADAARRWAEA